MVRELKCPYGDDFEGGEECDRCDLYELCIETYPPMNVIELPKGATNGNMMQNTFPNVPVKIFEDMNTVIFGNAQFDLDWWNAPYKSDCIPSEYDLSEDIELSNPQMYR